MGEPITRGGLAIGPGIVRTFAARVHRRQHVDREL